LVGGVVDACLTQAPGKAEPKVVLAMPLNGRAKAAPRWEWIGRLTRLAS